ncbi:MAG TPA: phage tail tube protein [Tepidisphaeraceae bacterium]|jgi:hypothetical protein|nr:phage tail tube protein [Tepidisphaeraceae bacterium]
MMPQLKKRRVLAFKLETTPGTAETLTAAECIWSIDPIIQYDIPQTDRFATGSLSRLVSTGGARSAKITFGVELAGGGADAVPQWADLLLGCGMVEDTATFSPTSDPADYKTVTFGCYQDGIVKKMAGAMGTFTVDVTSGVRGTINFEFTGIWAAVTDGAMLALPAYAVIPPRAAGATFTIGGSTKKISTLKLATNNTLKLVEDITDVTGYDRAVVTERNLTGNIDPESLTVAADGIYAAWVAGTTAALNLVIGATANNIVTITAPALQYINVQEGDRDGLVTNDAEFRLTCDNDEPDTELVIAFS